MYMIMQAILWEYFCSP